MQLKEELSFEQVALVWLRTEWYSNAYDGVRDLVDIETLGQDVFPVNDLHISELLLRMARRTILSNMELWSIKWHKAVLDPGEFENLRIIKEKSWSEMFDEGNTVKKVSEDFINFNYHLNTEGSPHHSRKINEIFDKIGKERFPEPLILIKKTRSEVATILEGNHRAIAFQARGLKKYIPKRVIVGVSQRMGKCIWFNG